MSSCYLLRTTAFASTTKYVRRSEQSLSAAFALYHCCDRTQPSTRGHEFDLPGSLVRFYNYQAPSLPCFSPGLLVTLDTDWIRISDRLNAPWSSNREIDRIVR